MHRRAVNHLKKVDPVMARVIERVGPCRLQQQDGPYFEYMMRAIVYQQLSGKAAATIHGRVRALFNGTPPSPEAVLAISDEQYRAAGLSRQKIAYMRDLARCAHIGEVPFDTLDSLSDDDILAALTRVKGIGRWTTQMFLLFRLGRPDVLPELDLGIRKGVQLAYRLRKLPPPKRVLQIGAKWSPYRSVATWYLWRLLDVPPEK